MIRALPDSARRVYFSVRANPPLVLLTMAGAALAAAVGLLAVSGPVAGAVFFLLYSCVCCGWNALLLLGFGRTAVTEYFVTLRFEGVGYVYQRRPKGRDFGGCRHATRELLAQRFRLPAALPPGKYRAVTHETIIRHMRPSDGLFILRSIPAYRADLNGLQARLLGCKRCPLRAACPIWTLGKTERQFYFIEFKKT